MFMLFYLLVLVISLLDANLNGKKELITCSLLERKLFILSRHTKLVYTDRRLCGFS